MIAAWLRQDPAVRSLPRWLPIAAFNSTLLLGIVAFASHAPATELLRDPWWIAASWSTVFWIAAAVFLASPGCRSRSGPFALSLPIAPRTLWLLHLIAVILCGAIILAVTGALVIALGALGGLMPDGALPSGPDAPRLAIRLLAGLVLAAVFLQTRRPGLQTIPPDRSWVSFLTVTLAGSLILVVMLGDRPLWVSFVPLVVGAALAAHTYRALPASFSVVPLEPSPGGARRDEARDLRRSFEDDADRDRGGSLGRAWFLASTLYRTLVKKPMAGLLIVPLLIFFGMVLAGGVLDDDGDFRYVHVAMVAYLLFAVSGPLAGRLYAIAHLPIPPRRLFAFVTLPGLFLLWIGYGAGSIMAARDGQSRELVTYRKTDCCYVLRVPIETCEIAWDGRPPGNGSPWGESHPPWTEPLFRGSRAVLYSPYSVPADASVEFVALQISRAAQSVYGERIPPKEIRDRYLDVDETGSVVPKPGGVSLAGDRPHLTPRIALPEFPVLMLASGILWLGALAAYLMAFRAAVSNGARKAVYVAILIVMLGAHIGQFVLAMVGWIRIWALSGAMRIGIRALTESVPGGAAGVWIGCALILAAAYWTVQRRFQRMEAVAGPWCGL